MDHDGPVELGGEIGLVGRVEVVAVDVGGLPTPASKDRSPGTPVRPPVRCGWFLALVNAGPSYLAGKTDPSENAIFVTVTWYFAVSASMSG